MMTARAGRQRTSEHHEPRVVNTVDQTARQVNAVDLLAFLASLIFVAGLTMLIDRTGQLSARLGFAGAAGLVAACLTAWRRLRRQDLRHWRNGQITYQGRRIKVAAAWGVEGQPPPAAIVIAEDPDKPASPAILPIVPLPREPED